MCQDTQQRTSKSREEEHCKLANMDVNYADFCFYACLSPSVSLWTDFDNHARSGRQTYRCVVEIKIKAEFEDGCGRMITRIMACLIIFNRLLFYEERNTFSLTPCALVRNTDYKCPNARSD